jgi:hypothetical protein
MPSLTDQGPDEPSRHSQRTIRGLSRDRSVVKGSHPEESVLGRYEARKTGAFGNPASIEASLCRRLIPSHQYPFVQGVLAR